jgi:hypothetical protein
MGEDVNGEALVTVVAVVLAKLSPVTGPEQVGVPMLSS